MSYRTDDDRTDERLVALREQYARQRDTLDQLDREHKRLTGEKVERPQPTSPTLNARTDEDRVALLIFAIDKAQEQILAQRRVNDDLKRAQHPDVVVVRTKTVLRWWHVLFKLFKLARKR